MSSNQVTKNKQKLQVITNEVIERSVKTRASYLERIRTERTTQRPRSILSCSNMAHLLAAQSDTNKNLLLRSGPANIGIITSYNDMLSAHQPYQDYPQKIKQIAASQGAIAQVAAGVPAMCDGITQGTDSMQLSLFSRDAIALSTTIGLSHNVFDGIIYLGICDKIVPGLLMAALSFGHLPAIFIPSGPMPSGISNKDKATVRQAYASGKADLDDLLKVEMQAYHSPGTCTFYGTANTNQMLLECLGLQLPGSSFVAPNSELREQLTRLAVERIIAISNQGEKLAISEIVNERSLINAIVGLLATGGSTNHSIHLIALGKLAGIELQWQDFAKLAELVPLLARVYPNGDVDVNDFNQAGGVNYIIGELLDAGMMHQDVNTIVGKDLSRYAEQPQLEFDKLTWQKAYNRDENIVRNWHYPFQNSGGLKILEGNLGTAIIKVSAVAEQFRKVRAQARVFATQQDFIDTYNKGELEYDHIAVVRYQGPAANGMPELHKLTPLLAVLQDKGFRVGLVTDGRMSGASGKVPAAIHLTPEAQQGGAIAKICDGDIIELDANKGKLTIEVDKKELDSRISDDQVEQVEQGSGRELFAIFREKTGSAAQGATIFN